jgi:hypothetical protein
LLKEQCREFCGEEIHFQNGATHLRDSQSVHEQPDRHTEAGDEEHPQPSLGLVDTASSLGHLEDKIVVDRAAEDGSYDRTYSQSVRFMLA